MSPTWAGFAAELTEAVVPLVHARRNTLQSAGRCELGAVIDRPAPRTNVAGSGDKQTGAGRSNRQFGRWRRWLTMNLDYVPLLRVMRKLHNIPRGQPPDFNGMKRFRQYVRTIFPRKKNGEIDENAVYLLPLLAMNPMGKEHVTGRVDVAAAGRSGRRGQTDKLGIVNR